MLSIASLFNVGLARSAMKRGGGAAFIQKLRSRSLSSGERAGVRAVNEELRDLSGFGPNSIFSL